jgi:hypothetical protein
MSPKTNAPYTDSAAVPNAMRSTWVPLRTRGGFASFRTSSSDVGERRRLPLSFLEGLPTLGGISDSYDAKLGRKSKAVDSRNAVDPLSKGRPTQEVRLLGPGFRIRFSEIGMCHVPMLEAGPIETVISPAAKSRNMPGRSTGLVLRTDISPKTNAACTDGATRT